MIGCRRPVSFGEVIIRVSVVGSAQTVKLVHHGFGHLDVETSRWEKQKTSKGMKNDIYFETFDMTLQDQILKILQIFKKRRDLVLKNWWPHVLGWSKRM